MLERGQTVVGAPGTKWPSGEVVSLHTPMSGPRKALVAFGTRTALVPLSDLVPEDDDDAIDTASSVPSPPLLDRALALIGLQRRQT